MKLYDSLCMMKGDLLPVNDIKRKHKKKKTLQIVL